MARLIWRAALCAAASVTLAAAAAAQQSGSDQLRDIERLLRDTPAPLPQEAGEEAPPIPDAAAAQIVPISSVALIGRDGAPLGPESGLPVEALRAALAGLVGPGTSAADIIRAHDGVKRLLREQGFLFTAVGDARLAPEGDGAALTVPVFGITVTKAEAVAPKAETAPPVLEKINTYLDRLRGMQNPRLADLERVSLLASDLPGVRRATFVPSAGETPGELQLFLNVEFREWNAVLFADNRQTPALGPVLAGGVFSLNSWNGLAATTELSAFNSFNGEIGNFDLEERHTIQLSQKLWLGDDGLMVEGRGLWSRTKPGDELADLGLKSREIQFGALVEYPLLRERALSVWAAGGFEWDRSISEIDGGGELSRDVTSVALARLRFAQRDGTGYTIGTVELRAGLDVLDATDSESVNPSRTGADGTFTSVRLDIEREQQLADGVSLYGRAAAQYSPDPLLANEQISAGGALFSKGYDPSEISADTGVLLYGEIRYDTDVAYETYNVGLQFYGFGDYASLQRNDDTTFDEVDLVSMGAGVRVNFEQTALTLEYAQPMSEPLARTGDKDPRYFFSLSQRF